MLLDLTTNDMRDFGFPLLWLIRNEKDQEVFKEKWDKYLDENGISYKLPEEMKEEFRDDREARHLNFEVSEKVPDGIYHVVCESYTIGVGHGVKVKDGHFVPAPTIRAIEDAYRNATGEDVRLTRPGYFWITGMEWRSDKHCFYASVTY